jgi:branched-chain amino acid transport system substrate-binding protein
MRNFNRRKFLQKSAVGAAALAAPSIITRPGWAQSGPIKLGFVLPLSGPAKYFGDSIVLASELVAKRTNDAGGVLGREIEIVAADSEFKTEVAQKRGVELLEGEKVDMISGLGTAIVKTLAQEANAHGKIFFASTIMSSETTGSEFLPTTFSLSPNYEMLARAAANWIARSDSKKVFILNLDTAGGRSASTSFRDTFEFTKKPDQEIVGDEFHALGRVSDFGPFVTKIMASGADTLFTGSFGNDLRLLLTQGAELGWNIKVVGPNLDDANVQSSLGDAGIGSVAISINHISIDTPQNKEWLKIWQDRYPDQPLYTRAPHGVVGTAISAAEWIVRVYEKAGSAETDKLIDAWEGDEFDALWGRVTMRACDHQMQTPLGVAEISPPAEIPEAVRIYGDEFPFVKSVGIVSAEESGVPPALTGNPRCTA